ncbi:glycosyltransferase [Chakrabartyella piscis]|uniref:glycosyltransferase n=1 Tax=Chakrabartyella piscis TaxID=2918914 RepID=UPI0029585DC8|nr:glycosyltransferase [Chakrabartyella piscis]
MKDKENPQNDLVSIIVPAYNAEATIKRCLDSIVKQSYREIEIIVINDGSIDDKHDILEEYKQLDSRIIVIHIENSGVSCARNEGLAVAKGKYIQFVDSDDWIEADTTKLLVQAIWNDCELVISDYTRVFEKRKMVCGDIKTKGIITRTEFALEMLKAPSNFYYGVLWNKLYHADIIKEHNLSFSEELSWCEDFLFNLEYLQYVKWVYILHQPLYDYVKTKGSLSSIGGDIKEVVGMKTALFKHYKSLYESMDLYNENKMKINRFYIDFARDTIKSYHKTRK